MLSIIENVLSREELQQLLGDTKTILVAQHLIHFMANRHYG